MRRCGLLLGGALLLSACAHHLPEDNGLPPLVRITHEGEVVSHSEPEERVARAVTCAYGRVREGDIYPVPGGFPAVVEAQFVDRFGVGSTEVTVFGGSLTEVPDDWNVRTTVVDGQYAEVASRRYRGLGFGLGVKKVRFAVMPVAGSRDGQSTVKLTASAADRKGRIARTTTPVMASPEVLCGSY
ncbi:hypothetical protein [Parvularcula maris]|uniref:Lipoprotein n=1 Tax=Parvularcula maris TaxID=2965077 RepID=A0A9X2L8X4_9PROT|nr:hypothetical protein [Parvularcula maris]MCQ8185256.1 hypothetical protein [Parvularcula maris]